MAKTEQTTEFVALAKNPVPSGGVCGTFESFDGARLRYAVWQASRGPKAGTVCLFGGRTEFIEKYFEVVADLRRRGFAVATMDWRGQGGSARLLKQSRRGHITDFAIFDQDLKRFVRDIVLPDCPPPYIALGHSMGGHILLRSATMPGLWFEKLVLTAPLLKLHGNQLKLSPGTARQLARLAVAAGFGGSYPPGSGDDYLADGPFENNQLTSDRERYSRNVALWKAAPHLTIGGPTWGWMNAALSSMAALERPDYPADIKVPVLFVVAGDDTVVSSRAIKDFAVRVKLARHIVVPHARHEILQEQDPLRQQFWAAFDAYVGVGQAVAA